jgi:hypothetical protein
MVGIDVHDLKEIRSRKRNHQDFRFISHPGDVLEGIKDENLGFWILWTCKEAVFKSQRQLHSFDPKVIEVHISVEIDGGHFSSPGCNGIYLFTDEMVLAVCSSSSVIPTYKVERSVSQNPSEEIRLLLKTDHKIQEISSDDNGIPTAIIHNQSHEISFSHHGRFMAYAMPQSHKP